MQRCAIPSPPQTKKRSAPAAQASAPAWAPLLFGTSTHIGSRTPWRASARRSSGRPPVRLPPCAITATVLTGRPPAVGACATPARAARIATASEPVPTKKPGGDVGGMVHAPIHPRQGHEKRDRDRDQPDDAFAASAADRACDQQRDAAVDGDRCGGVAGVVARVDREMVEAGDARPLAVDRERRDAIGRRLDGDRRQDERRDPPAPHTAATSIVTATTAGIARTSPMPDIQNETLLRAPCGGARARRSRARPHGRCHARGGRRS